MGAKPTGSMGNKASHVGVRRARMRAVRRSRCRHPAQSGRLLSPGADPGSYGSSIRKACLTKQACKLTQECCSDPRECYIRRTRLQMNQVLHEGSRAETEAQQIIQAQVLSRTSEDMA